MLKPYILFLYVDNIILLSPSRTGLQEMVKICENFAIATKLKFSTNIQIEKGKTKWLFCKSFWSYLRTNNLYVEGFDDYVITEMINM